MAFFAICSNAQVIYTEGFEGLNTGEAISQQVPAHWTTWSNNPGSAEDPLVTEAYAHTESKSIVIIADNDLVMTVGTLTENRYKMDFYLYVPAGSSAFYSPLQIFNPTGSGSKNGCQVFFVNGAGSIDASGEAAISTFTFSHDTWIHVVQYFDFDSDITQIYINDEIVHSGAWSPGINYVSNTLDGIDFYAWNNDGASTPEFYVDDIVFEQVEAVNPPQNLSLQLQNDFDIQLDWDVPVSGTPESYYIYRNGSLIDVVEEVITYTDNHIYPGVYEYYVTAFYGSNSGTSVQSNIESIEITGGAQRQLAILEVFTGTECTNANNVENSIKLLSYVGLDYVVLSYLQDAAFSVPYMTSRSDFYTPFFDEDANATLNCPTSIVNGMFGKEGYLGSLALQKAYYQGSIENVLEIKTLYTIAPTVTVESYSPYLLNIEVDMEELIPYYDTEVKLFAAITESDIAYSWQGLSKLNNVVREIENEVVDFSGGVNQSAQFSIGIDETVNLAKCKLVVFLQSMDDAHILEAYSIPLDAYVGMEQFIAKKSVVYPIPASDRIFITNSDNITSLEFMNCTGQIVLSSQHESAEVSVDLSELAAGVYFVKIYTSTGTDIQKIIIN